MPGNPFKSKSSDAAPQWPVDGEANGNGHSNGKALSEPLIQKHGRVSGMRLWLQQVRHTACTQPCGHCRLTRPACLRSLRRCW